MGNGKQYLESGGFSEYLYRSVSEPVTINGLKCHVIQHYLDKDGYFGGLPHFSNTSDVYVGLGNDGARQIRVFVDRKPIADFDWGHVHHNADGKKFDKGVVHVQRYHGAKGSDARYMSNAEIKKYGDIIKFFCPDAKLRP